MSDAGAPLPQADSSSSPGPNGPAPVIALVDQRELTRHCVEQWLLETWPDHRVLAVAKARELGLRLQRPTDLRFAVLGISAGQVMAPENLAVVTQLRRASGEKPVIVLAEGEDADDVVAIRAGARGYVPTSLDWATAVEAIRFVLAGGIFVPAGVLAPDASKPGSVPRRPAGVAALSPRELEVAARLREGKPNKTIAFELSISESTVKVFVRRILAKLGAANRTEAVFLIERHLAGPVRAAEPAALADPAGTS